MYKTNEYMDTYWNWIFLFKLWFMLNTNLKHLFRTPDTSRRYFEYTGWFYYGRTCHPVYTFPRLSSSYKVSLYMIMKGSVRIISSDLPFIERRVRFTLVTIKPLPGQQWGGYPHLYISEDWRLQCTLYTPCQCTLARFLSCLFLFPAI